MNSSERSSGADTTAQASPRTLSERPGAFDDQSLVTVHSPDAECIGQLTRLSEDAVVVGRDVAGPGLSVRDTQMSRLHFRIVFDRRARCFRLGDARSRNGTFINGQRVEAALLEPGTVIRAGETLFVVGPENPLARAEETVSRLGRTALSVLIFGETGAGKERFARALHDASGREGRWVAINCAALSKDLLGAELFGHTKGAFSGAGQARSGLFVAADKGTLFLDEIGDFPFELQAVLLRSLQERTVRAIGSDVETAVDVRVLAATHADIDRAVAEKRFRADLYARLAQTTLRVPPLRERKTALLALAHSFAHAGGRAAFQISTDAAELLLCWDWPLNVRELESLVAGFLALGSGDQLNARYLREQHARILNRDPHPAPLAGTSRNPSTDREALASLLREHGGNVSVVARQLGKPRAQVYRWLRVLGLSPDRYR